MDSHTFRWYALKIHSRAAKASTNILQGKGFEVYLPLYRERRQWSDRARTFDVPLFPGYLFCRFDPFDRLVPVLTTPGVTGIVSAGKTPLPVSEHELEAVRNLLSCGLAAHPWPYLPVGARVAITRGPLAGLEGVVTSADQVDRFVVSVTLLQRSVAVVIDRAWAIAA